MTQRTEANDKGLTLVELLVTIVLLAILGSLVTGAVIVASRSFVHTNDEQQGLSDAKVVLDRVARDIRESRGVLCDGGLADPEDPTSADPECTAHLQLWLDGVCDNLPDYQYQPEEKVDWRLRRIDDIHFDVVRLQGEGTDCESEQLVATSLIMRALFEYDTPQVPEDASLVTLRMTYDAIAGVGVDARDATTTARLRNGVAR